MAQNFIYEDELTEMPNLSNYCVSQIYDEDESQTYHLEFLKTSGQPKTSTQKPLHEKPHIYHPYNIGNSSAASASNALAPKKFNYTTKSSKVAETTPRIVNRQVANDEVHSLTAAEMFDIVQPSQATTIRSTELGNNNSIYQPATTTSHIVCSKCDSNEKLILANTVLLKALIKEVKYLRREQQNNNNATANQSNGILQVKLDLPATTVEDFKKIEEQSANEEYEQALIKTFKRINDPNLDKYVRACLRAIVSDEVACCFSWFGQNSNIPVKSYNIMNLIKETTIERFPATRPHETIHLIKRWFQYAKDRHRKSIK